MEYFNKKLNAYWSALFDINVNKAALIINLTTYGSVSEKMSLRYIYMGQFPRKLPHG